MKQATVNAKISISSSNNIQYNDQNKSIKMDFDQDTTLADVKFFLLNHVCKSLKDAAPETNISELEREIEYKFGVYKSIDDNSPLINILNNDNITIKIDVKINGIPELKPRSIHNSNPPDNLPIKPLLSNNDLFKNDLARLDNQLPNSKINCAIASLSTTALPICLYIAYQMATLNIPQFTSTTSFKLINALTSALTR